MKYKVGDRVEFRWFGNKQVGTIKGYNETDKLYAVSFFGYKGLDCNGLVPDNTGIWLYEKSLKLVDPKFPTVKQMIDKVKNLDDDIGYVKINKSADILGERWFSILIGFKDKMINVASMDFNDCFEKLKVKIDKQNKKLGLWQG